jgi:hypothetical protein
MKTIAPVGDDFFVGRKRRFSRGGERARGAHPLNPPRSQRKDERDHSDKLQEQSERIRLTIANRSLETHFQPIVDLRSGEAIGTEALSRFARNRPDHPTPGSRKPPRSDSASNWS